MRNDVNRQWLLVRRPEGLIRADDFQLREVPIPVPDQGQVLVRNLWLSFDPTQSGWMRRDTYVPIIPLGDVMRAASVGQVIESKHRDYKPGEFVQGAFGWQDYIATDGAGFLPMRKLPAGVPANLALSLFGITGPTAYFGVLDVGQVKAGETFVVSGAAGATGSVAGQIAKIKGCRVIGTAGGKAKCDWLKNELGFDDCLDHRDPDLAAKLKDACPKGIDVYFENVGGVVFDAVFPQLNAFARMPVCGLIAEYNNFGETSPKWAGKMMRAVLTKRLTIRGFIVSDFASRHADFLRDMSAWVREGKVKHKEFVTEGLDSAPAAFMGLLKGANFGKQLVRVGPDKA